MGGTGPAVLDGWHAALELGHAQFGWAASGSGAGGPHEVWMGGGPAAQELGARRVWMGGTWLRNWGAGPSEFGCWHAALEQGARGFDTYAGHF